METRRAKLELSESGRAKSDILLKNGKKRFFDPTISKNGWAMAQLSLALPVATALTKSYFL